MQKTVQVPQPTRIRCSKCGYKIRGKNHEEGEHHKKGECGHTKEK